LKRGDKSMSKNGNLAEREQPSSYPFKKEFKEDIDDKLY
jgi:hypothetical protein